MYVFRSDHINIVLKTEVAVCFFRAEPSVLTLTAVRHLVGGIITSQTSADDVTVEIKSVYSFARIDLKYFIWLKEHYKTA